VSYEKNEKVRQTYLFKGQMSAFYFSMHHPNSFKYYDPQSDHTRKSIAAVIAEVAETTGWSVCSPSVNNTCWTM